MKTKNTNLIQGFIRFILFSTLALTLLFLYSNTLYSSESESYLGLSQNEKVTVMGMVLDANSNAIDSVVISEEDSDNETVSDTDGSFVLSLNDAATISFSKLGFQHLDMEIAESDSNLVVILIAESNELVVQGFGSETAGTKDNKWMLDSLSAITDNPPLYIIDDRQEESDFSISTIDPDDVVTIEVLSDSIAEGLYGSDGERGAIKITTNSSGNIMDRQSPPMQLNNNDSAAIILKDKYKMYLDTMNARNARLRERNNKGSSKTMMPIQNELPVDSVSKENKKDLDVKMESAIDTTSISIERDTTLIDTINDTTSIKMQVDTTSIETKNDTITPVNGIK